MSLFSGFIPAGPIPANFRVAILALAGSLFSQYVHAQATDADSLPPLTEGRDIIGDNQVRVHWSKSSETDLATVVVGDFDASPESNYLIGASWGHKFSDTLFGLPFPMTANLGVQYFNERDYQPDGWGATAYIKAHHAMRIPFTDKHVTVGLGEGVSYVSRIPMSEKRDFAKKGVESVKFMNYLEWTIDLPLRQFAPFESLMRGHIEELSVGFIVWHRSSVFGIYGDSSGGVNFMGFSIEARY